MIKSKSVKFFRNRNLSTCKNYFLYYVLLITFLLSSGSAFGQVTLPYSQSFNTSGFPSYWGQNYSGGVTNNRWIISASGYAGGSANEAVAVHSNSPTIGIARLYIGPINTTGMTSLNLSFRHFYSDFSSGLTYKIQHSSDGVNWINDAFVHTSGNGNEGPALVNTIVSGLGSTTYIAWVLDGDIYNFNNWFIDDVNIKQQMINDAAAATVLVDSILPTGNVAPTAEVINLGTAANTFNVQMVISGGYSSTKSVTLASGASQVVTFDPWNADGGSHTITACTQLAIDQYTLNDCISKTVKVIAGWTYNSAVPASFYLGSGAGYSSGSNLYLFSIGGNTSSGSPGESYKYNVSTNSWSMIAPLPQYRKALATAVVGNYLYAIGGSDFNGNYASSVYRYGINENTWTSMRSLPSAIAWDKAVVYNNKIYLAGGYNGIKPLSSVYVYDINTNSWSSADSMPGARYGGAFSIVGNKLVYIAGAGYSGITNTVFTGEINPSNPFNILWTIAAKTFPGIEHEAPFTEGISLYDDVMQKGRYDLLQKSSLYPGGALYRFDGAPWGSDGIIVAGGSSDVNWIPVYPSPCYVYKPLTDTWIQQGQVPTSVLGASIGTVHDGNTWKLVAASGLGVNYLTTSLTQIFTATIASTFQLSVNVMDGWNMVSIPGLHPLNQNVNTWWPYRTPLVSVYRWTPGYVIVSNVAPKEGYWMMHNGARTYNTGDEWPSSGIELVAHEEIPLTSGWNMICGYENTVAVSSLTTTPPGIIVAGTIYGWNGNYSNAPNLVPGYSYWVYTSASGFINTQAAFDKISSDEGGGVLGIDDVPDKIIITDASGKSFSLYSLKSEANDGHYLMPPLPPAGSFDVRFSSGRRGEYLKGGSKSIDLKGIQYPVKIKTENIAIKIQDETGKLISSKIKPGEEIVIKNSEVSKLLVSLDEIIKEYSLSQNYPNPFNPSTKIEYTIPNAGLVTLKVYSILGEEVKSLVNEIQEPGSYSISFNGTNLASGMYIYKLTSGNYTSIHKMLLLK